MIKRHLFILFLIFSVSTKAQLLNEIGFFVGGSNYSGDIGNEMYIYPNKLGGSLIYRRNVNERLTLRGTISIYPLQDDDRNSTNPVRQARGFKFQNTLYESTVGVEFNYLDYDVTSYQDNYTPYLFFEFSAFSYKTADRGNDGNISYSSNLGFAIPIGVGFKSKITHNWSYSVELRTRYALTDDLDYSNENIIQSYSGNPHINDWYFFTGVGLTYSFGRPPCAVPRRD